VRRHSGDELAAQKGVGVRHPIPLHGVAGLEWELELARPELGGEHERLLAAAAAAEGEHLEVVEAVETVVTDREDERGGDPLHRSGELGRELGLVPRPTSRSTRAAGS